MLFNIEPPITSQLEKNTDESVPWIYSSLCLGDLCRDPIVTTTVYITQAVSFLFCSLLICWILVLSFRKFLSDGAQIEEEAGNSISHTQRPVNNRVGKTIMAIRQA
mmetsp:Transcript_38622/g.50646  ORF Transcript_38622/g.50646 Transcript_38622/m.50646 type:complete len:106 (+) Transcript_38622:1355-1672(+)